MHLDYNYLKARRDGLKLNSPHIHQKLALLLNQPVSLSPPLIQIPDGLLSSSHTYVPHFYE